MPKLLPPSKGKKKSKKKKQGARSDHLLPKFTFTRKVEIAGPRLFLLSFSLAPSKYHIVLKEERKRNPCPPSKGGRGILSES